MFVLGEIGAQKDPRDAIQNIVESCIYEWTDLAAIYEWFSIAERALTEMEAMVIKTIAACPWGFEIEFPHVEPRVPVPYYDIS